MEQNKIIQYKEGQLKKLDNLISLTDKLLEIDNRQLHIVHLDDHKIYRKGVRLCLLEKLPNISIEEFPNNETALTYITECFENKKEINLIITDYNHPGPNGLFFAKEVREIEKMFLIKTKIVLLTMCWENELLTKATEEGVFNAYFPKSIETEQLIKFVKNSNEL